MTQIFFIDPFITLLDKKSSMAEKQAWQNCEAKIEFIDDLVYSADDGTGAWISRL